MKNQAQQDQALSLIYRAALQIAVPPVPVDISTKLGIIQTELESLTAKIDGMLQSLAAPARLTVFVQNRRPTGMATAISDISVFARVQAADAIGRTTVDPNPFTWTVTPAEAATVSADPNHADDTSYMLVSVTAPDAAGNQASFVLSVTDGTLSGSSDQLDPTAGIPTSLVISISPD